MPARLKYVLMLALFWTTTSAVAVNSGTYVPPDLQPWKNWVLKGKEYRDCPFFFNRTPAAQNDFVCSWSGRLELVVEAGGGRFRQSWTVYATEEWVPLPGDLAHWPQQVTINGQPVSVIARGEVPSVRLRPGLSTLSGRFEWQERPRDLRVPAQTGLLDLRILGERVERPERSDRGVWLGERQQQKKAEDALQVQAFRLVADDVPTRMTSVFRLEVSGSVREELIGPTLPAGFIPLSIDSELPTRLEPDGNLRLQVRPGSWEVTIHARAAAVLNELTLLPSTNNLPGTEIWSFRSDDELRVSVPEGLPPVDPLQVGVPESWVELPAFRVDVGGTLSIAERSRGAIAADNQLILGRQLWLDFSGDGFVFSDAIRGTMRNDWRLDMAAPYALLSATEEDDNLLVTQGATTDISGVEVRRSQVGLQAVGRVEARGRLPVTGWQARFNTVTATLNLPLGHKLFAATGADRSSMSWVNRWKLLDFFLVLIVSISIARLFGRWIGALALIGLTLTLHESGAPAFIWLNLLVAVALARVAPPGMLLRSIQVYRAIGFVLLVAIFVPFATEQLRIAIYPQLERQVQTRSQNVGRLPELDSLGYVTDGGADQENVPSRRQSTASELQSKLSQGYLGSKISKSFNRYAPNATVQVGPGRPTWQWNNYRLSWSGPVDADQTMRLIVLPRWFVTLLRFVAVFVLGFLIAVFAFEVVNRRPPWSASGLKAKRPPVSGPGAAVVILLALLAAAPAVANADTPSPAILAELQNRLLEPPECADRCAEIIDAKVTIGANSVTIRLTANALETVAVPLPGSLQGWRPEQIQVDGSPAEQILRSVDGVLWARVQPGRRSIQLVGPLPPVDSLEIPFPTPPRVIRVETSDWFVAGVEDQRLLSGSLQLTRLQKQGADVGRGDSAARWESSRFPVFALVERGINLDLDWRATTTVYRIAPQQGAITIKIPLLAGESVISEGLTVADGEVLVSMNPDVQTISWESTLPRESPFILKAPADAPWKEVWRFAIGSIWHADFAGVPQSEVGETNLGYRVAQFFPRADEQLEMTVERPEASAGDTLVFDQVRLSTDVGERSRTSSLGLDYRSTRGAQHLLRLPSDSEIVSVSIDNEVSPLRAEQGELRLPILPGAHNVEIQWRNDRALGMWERTPAVDLGAAAGNLHLGLNLAHDRWVLATAGPGLGPAVLYWSELFVLFLVALLLGREKLTPLGTRQWLLLGLGFSTFSWVAFTLVAVWLLATGVLKSSRSALTPIGYNATQILFALLCAIALGTIVVSLPMGLLGRPDMHVLGNGSYGNDLKWFADRSDTILPGAQAFSLPLWIYKALILGWALWLSFALLRWLPWVWRQFAVDGLWKPLPKRAPAIDPQKPKS